MPTTTETQCFPLNGLSMFAPDTPVCMFAFGDAELPMTFASQSIYGPARRDRYLCVDARTPMRFPVNPTRSIYIVAGRLRADITTKTPRSTSTRSCVICLCEDARCVFVPCGHLCMCSACASDPHLNRRRCAVCRASVTNIVTIYD